MKTNLTFKKIYPNYETFQNKIIDVIQEEYPDSEWCSYEKMLTSWKNIYKAMFRVYSWRTVRYEAQQTHNLIINQFIEYLPEFYLKQRVFLKANLEKFDDVKSLGEILSANKNLIQNQLQNASSTNATENFVSPQGFIDSIEEMAISEGQKADSKSVSDAKSELNLSTKDETYRYNFLEKLEQLANNKFRYFLKDLLDNFNHIFRVVQVLTQGDETIYLKLKDVLTDSKNIKFLFDDKTFTVTCDLNNVKDLANILEQIEETLNKKVNIDFKNVSLKTIVSPEPTNNLIVDENNQLFAKGGGGGGGKYIGDNKTVKIDEKNVVSAVGLITNDKSDFMTGADLKQVIGTIDNEINNFSTTLKEVKAQIQQNEIALANLTQQEKLLTGLFNALKNTLDNTRNEVSTNTKDINLAKKAFEDLKKIAVFKDKLQEVVSKDKDNSLKIGTDNNLFVSNTNGNKWELIQTEKDWDFQEKDKQWKNVKPININQTSAYLLIYKNNSGIVTSNASCLTYGYEIYANDNLKYNIFNFNSVLCYSLFWEFNFLIGITYTNFPQEKDSDISNKKDKFWIFEMKNFLPDMPVPPKPEPIIKKIDVYNFLKGKLNE